MNPIIHVVLIFTTKKKKKDYTHAILNDKNYI